MTHERFLVSWERHLADTNLKIRMNLREWNNSCWGSESKIIITWICIDWAICLIIDDITEFEWQQTVWWIDDIRTKIDMLHWSISRCHWTWKFVLPGFIESGLEMKIGIQNIRWIKIVFSRADKRPQIIFNPCISFTRITIVQSHDRQMLHISDYSFVICISIQIIAVAQIECIMETKYNLFILTNNFKNLLAAFLTLIETTLTSFSSIVVWTIPVFQFIQASAICPVSIST